MKHLTLIFILSITIFVSTAQDTCHCPDTLIHATPIFTHLSDISDPVESSRKYLRQYLNENISATNLIEDVVLRAGIFVGKNGKVCDIILDTEVSDETKQHINSVLSGLQPFKNTCFKFTKSININKYIKGGEELYRVTSIMPLFNGCQRLVDEKDSKNCSNLALEKYLFNHPAYGRLSGLERTTYVLDFVITPEGKTTMVTPKKGNFEDKLPIFKQIIEEMPPWQPAIMRNEKVNLIYTIPVKVR